MSSGERVPPIYTRTGDKGKTSLIGGARVSKAHLRLDAYGTIDELNSVIGVLIAAIAKDLVETTSGETSGTGRGRDKDGDGSRSAGIAEAAEAAELTATLTSIQNQLFNIGSQLACENTGLRAQLPAIAPEDITTLEKRMDAYTEQLQPLKNFILPGGSQSAGFAHLARTVCRRAERLCVALDESAITTAISTTGGEDQEVKPSTIDPILIQYVNRLSDYLFVLARHLNHLMGIKEPIWSASESRRAAHRAGHRE